MPTLTITKNYDDGTTLTESQLDDIKSSIETFVNTTKLNSDNIQTGGIATANYAAASVDAAAIASSAVTTAKINDSAVTTAKINDSAVTTAKINDAAVTQAKRAALGQQISSAIDFNTTSTSYVDVTNATVTITTTGRPVYLSLNAGAPATNTAWLAVTPHASNGGRMALKLVKDSTDVAEVEYQAGDAGGSTIKFGAPFVFIDTPSAGTYTYKLQLKEYNGGTAFVRNWKLIAFEL